MQYFKTRQHLLQSLHSKEWTQFFDDLVILRITFFCKKLVVELDTLLHECRFIVAMLSNGEYDLQI